MKHSQNHAHVYDFMKHHHMGVLSTVAEDSKPWGAAIFYVVDEEFNVFFVTRQETFKYKNLDNNPYAALTIADEENQTTVQLSGKISRVPAEDYMDIIFTRLVAIRPKGDMYWAPPVEKVSRGDYMALRLTPDKLHYANFKKQTTDLKHDYIEKII